MVSIFVENVLQCTDGTNVSRNLAGRDCKVIAFHNAFDRQLHIAFRFNMGIEDLNGFKGTGVLLLVCKDICFLLILQIVINHTPNRSLARPGSGGDSLNGMLTIKNIIGAVPAAYLDRVNLVNIEILCSPSNMGAGNGTLIGLV